MSFSMTLVPISYIPYATYSIVPQVTAASVANAAATATAAAAESAVSTATATAATTATVSESAAASTAAAAAVSQSAAAATAASAAFAAAALPVAVTILGILAAGMTLEMVKQSREMKKRNIMEIPTVFTSRDRLIDALFAYDGKGKCEVTENLGEQTVTARYELEDFVFRMNNETGCYDLTIKNAGNCQRMLSQINALQEEYTGAVTRNVVERIYEKAESSGWVIESDTIDEEETRTISLYI